MGPRLRPLVWIVAVLVVAAAFYIVLRQKRDLVDFEVYRTAATRAIAAEPLYRPEDGHYQFKYLPAFALAMAPFAALPPEVARALWFALSIGLLVVFVRQSVLALPDRRLPQRTLFWLVALFMAKFYVHELALGQTNILLGVLLLTAVFVVPRNQPWLAGALVALCVFIKPYALVLLPWLALTRGGWALASAAGVLVAGLMAPAAVYGTAANSDLLEAWYHTVTDTTSPNLLMPENISLATMWAKWLGPGREASVLAVMSAIAALAFAVKAWAQRRRVASPDYLEFGLLMLLVPLLSPQGWDYVLLLATPAIVCLVDRWQDLTPPWRLTTMTAVGLMSFTIFDVLGRSLYVRAMALSVVTVSALVVVIGLVELRQRSLA